MDEKIEIFKERFAKNILVITGGTVLAQAISVLLTPIVTRLYSPEEYGLFTVYSSLLALFAGSQSLRYELGIPIADNEENAINVLGLSSVILAIFSGITLLIVSLFGDEVLSRILGQKLSGYRLLIPVGFLSYGTYQILIMWSFRKKDFNSIAKSKLSQSIGANLTKVSLGLLGIGPIGLIVSKIIGESAAITPLLNTLRQKDRGILKKIKSKKIVANAKRFINFPLYSLPGTFLSKLGEQIPILFIASLYGGQVVGYYGLAKSLVAIPTILIGNSIGDVFYGEAATLSKTNPERLKQLSIGMFKKLLFIGIVPLTCFMVFAPVTFKLLFGDEWYEAGIYARIMSVWAFSQLIFQPVSRVYDIFERQKDILIITLVRVTLILAVFCVAGLTKLGSSAAIWAYVSMMVIIYSITYLKSLNIIDRAIKACSSIRN